MMFEKKCVDFLAELSSSAPVPGGGGASAAVGAFATALGMMVGNLTVGKKKYADVEEEIQDTLVQLELLQKKLVALVDEDAKVFEPLSKAYGLPKNTLEEKAEKERVLEKVLYDASMVPLGIMETVYQSMALLEIMGDKGSRLVISDVGVAILFAQAALEGASLNIFINTKLMKDAEHAKELNTKADKLIRDSKILSKKIYDNVLEHIK